MDIARQFAGDDWYFLQLQRLQCNDIDETYTVVGPPGFNGAPTGFREGPAVPTKVFDNVYYVGGMEVGGWVIDTGDGYIMLDSSYDYGVDTILLPGMKKLGLDPAKVKYILITHGSGPKGGDHSGGVKYFYDNFGTKVVMSGPEWERTKIACGSAGPDCWVQSEDVIVGTDEQTLTAAGFGFLC